MKKPLLLLAFLGCAFSAYTQWEQVGLAAGITGLPSYQTSLDYLIANTSALGVGRSLDNGLSFEGTSIPVYPNAMMVQNDTLYVAGYYSQVLFTTDIGTTFTSIEGGSILDKGVTDMVPYQADKILVASRKDGVHVYNKTTQSWSRIGYAGKEISCVLVHNDTLFAGVQYDGVYKSSDGGANWSLSYKTYSNGPQDMIVHNGKIYLGTYGTGIKVSADNGQSWQNFNDGLVNPFAGSRFCRSNDNHLFVCGYGEGVFHYDEALQKWVSITANLPEITTEQMAISDTFLFVTTGVNSKKLFRRPIASAIVDAPVLPQLKETTLQLQPNPCTVRVRLAFDGSSATAGTPLRITVADVMGKRCYDQTHASGPDLSIDVSRWPAGLYFVSAAAADGSVWKAVLVKG